MYRFISVHRPGTRLNRLKLKRDKENTGRKLDLAKLRQKAANHSADQSLDKWNRDPVSSNVERIFFFCFLPFLS